MEVYKKHHPRGWVAFQFTSNNRGEQSGGEMWPVCDCLFLTSLSLGKGDCIERGHEEAAKRFFALHSFREGEGYFKIQGTDREDDDLREGLARHMLC